MRFDDGLLLTARDMFYKVYVDIDRIDHYEGREDTTIGDRIRIYPTKWDYEEPEIIRSNEGLAEYIKENGGTEMRNDIERRYEVTFADGTAAFIAAQSEEALGSFAILEWAAGEYDEDYDNLETDGTDIWVNENGGQRKLATISSIEEVREMNMTVYGRAITDRDMEAIASYMDDDIREDLHCDLAPCTHEEFIAAYLERDPEFEELLRTEFNFER